VSVIPYCMLLRRGQAGPCKLTHFLTLLHHDVCALLLRCVLDKINGGMHWRHVWMPIVFGGSFVFIES
jgi:hypothetical protein